MKSFLTAILFVGIFVSSSLAYAANSEKLPLDSLTSSEKIELISLFSEQTAQIHKEIKEANKEILDGEFYYNVGSVTSMISGWTAFISFLVGLDYDSLPSTNKDKLVKDNKPLSGNKIEKKTLEYEAKLRDKGRFLRWRKLSEESLQKRLKIFEAGLKDKSSLLSKTEIQEAAAKYKTRWRTRWGVFCGSLLVWGVFEGLEKSQASRVTINTETRDSLLLALEAHMDKLNGYKKVTEQLDKL